MEMEVTTGNRRWDVGQHGNWRRFCFLLLQRVGVMHGAAVQTPSFVRVLPSPASYTCSPGTTLFRGQYTGERGTRLISFLIYLILEKTCDKQMIRIGGGGGLQDDPAPAQVTLEKENLSSRLNI